MRVEQDYELIYKKWYFWIPLLFMSIACYAWIKELPWYFHQTNKYLFFLYSIMLISNTLLLLLSYIYRKKIVHRICGILMIVLLVFQYILINICSDYLLLYVFSLHTIVLSVLSGFILIGFSLIKTNPNKVDKNNLQIDIANQPTSIQSDYKLIYKKWYFWIPLVLTLIASIPFINTFILSYNGFEQILFTIRTIIFCILILYCTFLVGVYIFISRRIHLFCGILMMVLAIGILGIGNIPIQAGFELEFKQMWFAYHSISMLLNFISGVLLVVFSSLKKEVIISRK